MAAISSRSHHIWPGHLADFSKTREGVCFSLLFVRFFFLFTCLLLAVIQHQFKGSCVWKLFGPFFFLMCISGSFGVHLFLNLQSEKSNAI